MLCEVEGELVKSGEQGGSETRWYGGAVWWWWYLGGKGVTGVVLVLG